MKLDEEDDDDYDDDDDDDLNVFNQLKPLTKRRQAIISCHCDKITNLVFFFIYFYFLLTEN